MEMNKDTVLTLLKEIIHPEKKQDIVSLGCVKRIAAGDSGIEIELVLPRKHDPFGSSIKRNVLSLLEQHFGKTTPITVTLLEEEQKENVSEKSGISSIKNIIAVSAGKGGVGKSTVAVNLAIAVALQGYRTGLLDADVYGPSVPIMTGSADYKPFVKEEDGIQKMIPLDKFGIRIMSIGFFVDSSSPVIWRGPMATNVLKQLIHQTDWGSMDYLFIDLPPGTGDIHISIVQELPLTGAVIVSTPQKVALADVVKGIEMFRADKINVPVLGIIENMAWFTPEEMPSHRYYIFGKEGCRKVAEKYHVPLLGQIPLVMGLTEAGDEGIPVALDQETQTGKAFHELSLAVIKAVEERNRTLPPSKKVEVKK